MKFPAVTPQSISFLKTILDSEDRVLVTGAGGWFGLTLAALLKETQAQSMLVTNRPRQLNWNIGSAFAWEWDLNKIAAFSPTMVIDCAFILRDFLDDYSLESYISENHKLTSKLLQLTSLDSVNSVIYVSSGAAISPENCLSNGITQNPYGHIKRVTELAISQLGSELGKNTLVVRPFSLSGSLVTRPKRYAFSNIISQARSGEILINAEHEVWRKFVSVEDFFALSIATVKDSSGYLNSGGELLELSDFAQRVVETLGVQATIQREINKSSIPDFYASVDSSWASACNKFNFSPSSLENQILTVDGYLNQPSAN